MLPQLNTRLICVNFFISIQIFLRNELSLSHRERNFRSWVIFLNWDYFLQRIFPIRFCNRFVSLFWRLMSGFRLIENWSMQRSQLVLSWGLNWFHVERLTEKFCNWSLVYFIWSYLRKRGILTSSGAFQAFNWCIYRYNIWQNYIFFVWHFIIMKIEHVLHLRFTDLRHNIVILINLHDGISNLFHFMRIFIVVFEIFQNFINMPLRISLSAISLKFAVFECSLDHYLRLMVCRGVTPIYI